MHRTKITKWEGNIGSNLIQLAKSVHLAKCIGSQVVLPKLIDYNLVQLQLFTIEKRKSFFKRMFSKKSTNEHALKTIPFFEKEYYDVNLDLTTDIDSSFNRSDRQYSDLEANKRVQSSLYSPRLRNICCNTIRPILLSVYHNKKKVSTEDETLVVHITSDPQKVIPPFAYIENILEYEKYTKIIICGSMPKKASEINPLYEHLVTYCNNNSIKCDLQHRTLSEDLNIIMSSKNVVITNDSNFIRIALLSSKNIKNIYVPRVSNLFEDDIMMKTYVNDMSVSVRSYAFKNYYNPNESWDINQSRRMKISMFDKRGVVLEKIS